MQPAGARSLAGRQWRIVWNLYRDLSDRTGCFHISRNTATTFDVFFWLQVTNFDVSLLRSAPNGADHIDIDIFLLHTCTPPEARLIKTYALGQDNSVSLLQFTQGLDTPIFAGGSRSHTHTQFCSRVSLSVGSSPTRERGRH